MIDSVKVGATAAEVAEVALTAYQRGVNESAAEVRALSGKFGIAESAIAGFFGTMHEAQVPLDQVPKKLQELAIRYKDLLDGMRSLRSDDPEVRALKMDGSTAIEAGPSSYHVAEELLRRAEIIDRSD